MKDVSIRARLIAGFLAVVGLTALAAVIVLDGFREASAHYEEALEACSSRAAAGMALQAALLEQVKAQKNYLLRNEAAYLQEATGHGERVREARARMEAAADGASERGMLSRLDAALDALDEAFRAQVGVRQRGDIEAADRAMRGRATAVAEIVAQIVAAAQQQVLQERDTAVQSARRTRLITVGLVGCVGIVAVGIGAALSLSITRPLKRLQSQIQALTEDSAIPPQPAVEGRNEVAAIARAFHDLLQRASLLREMEARSRRLVTLSSRIAQAQEEERGRISRELHDGLGQALTAIKLSLSAAGQALGADALPVHEHLAKAKSVADQSLDELRRLVFDLRPPALDNLGLVAALESHARNLKDRSGLTVVVQAEPFESRLPSEVETALYRICQEALTNVWKHAGATEAVVRLDRVAGMVRLSVVDDGVGFDAATVMRANGTLTGLGLLSMERRAEDLGGTFHVESRPGAGTTIRVSLPCHPREEPWGR